VVTKPPVDRRPAAGMAPLLFVGRSMFDPVSPLLSQVELSQFDMAIPDGIRIACELGMKDGDAFVKAHGNQ
jgi:hypothetical protein